MTKLANQPKENVYSLRANIPQELAERLARIAREENDTLSRLVFLAVRRYVVAYEEQQR